MDRLQPVNSVGLGEQISLTGAHICHIYESESERSSAIREFLGNGLRLGERTYYIGEMPEQRLAEELLGYQDISFQKAKESGSFVSEPTQDFYMKDGIFDPNRISQQWRTLVRDSLSEGYPGIRIVGELLPEWAELGGCTTLLMYESRVNAEFPASAPVRVICQYDVRCYDARTIMGLLKAHPMILAAGRVYANPLYIPMDTGTSH